MKRLLQKEENFYSIHEGLKVSEGLFDLLKRSHDDGDAELAFDDGPPEEHLKLAKSALVSAIQVTRPLGLKSSNGKTDDRILPDSVDLNAVAEGLKRARAVVDVAEGRCRAGSLLLCDSAIEFGETELVFTPQEYIDFAKRALADALEKAKEGTLRAEASYVDYKVLDGRPNWERRLIQNALPLGALQRENVRNEVKRAKLVFGFDVSKEFKGLVFFGRAYFLEMAKKGGSAPAGDVMAFTYHSELEGHLKLAAALMVLKGSCDLM